MSHGIADCMKMKLYVIIVIIVILPFIISVILVSKTIMKAWNRNSLSLVILRRVADDTLQSRNPIVV